MQEAIHVLEERAEVLRHKSILLRLARGEPTGLGLAWFGDDDDLWDTVPVLSPSRCCPFERQRAGVVARVAREEHALTEHHVGVGQQRRRLAIGVLLSALACPGCGAPGQPSAGDPAGAYDEDDATTGDTTGFDVNTVTSAGSGASGTSDTSGTSSASATSSGNPEEPEDDEPPLVANLRINWSKDPDKITKPGPAYVRVDASDAGTGIDRVEFSHNKSPAPIVVGTDDGDGSFGATFAIDHQKFAGTTTFTVRAFDIAGNSASASVTVEVELLPSGYTSALTGTNHASAAEVWSDLEIDSNGELVIVGHYTADGETPRLVVERRSPDAAETIASDFEQPAPEEATYGSAVALDGEELLVLAHTPAHDVIVRYGGDGTITHTKTSSGVEYRDLVVAAGEVIIVGNVGELGVEPTQLRLWWYTPTLALQYQRSASVGDGPDLNAATRVRIVGDDVIAAGFVEQAGERGAWIGSFTAKSATELWQHVHYDGQDEVFADFTPVDGGRIVTIGTARVNNQPRVRLRRLSLAGDQPLDTDRHDVPNLPFDSPLQYGLRVARTPGAGEFVIAARTCTLEQACRGAARRYRWSNLGPSPQWWNDNVGLKSPTTTVTDVVEGPWGYTFALSHCLVNYGQGKHDQASLDRYNP